MNSAEILVFLETSDQPRFPFWAETFFPEKRSILFIHFYSHEPALLFHSVHKKPEWTKSIYGRRLPPPPPISNIVLSGSDYLQQFESIVASAKKCRKTKLKVNTEIKDHLLQMQCWRRSLKWKKNLEEIISSSQTGIPNLVANSHANLFFGPIILVY